MKKTLIPLVILIILLAFLAIGLTRNPREIPSPLLGKSAPEFSAPHLNQAEQSFSSHDLLGQVWLLNVWASWCVACRQEHPVLMGFIKTNTVPLIGLNYKDNVQDGVKWLTQHGNPYTLSVADTDGHIGINHGVYGVPETFLIDKAGIIRYKHAGPITDEVLKQKILPMIRAMQ